MGRHGMFFVHILCKQYQDCASYGRIMSFWDIVAERLEGISFYSRSCRASKHEELPISNPHFRG